MTSIQIVLITLSLLVAVFGSHAFRAKLPSRLLAAFFFVTATGLILFPASTTVLAHALGVGRGTDLLLYIAILAGIHAVLMLYVRTIRLNRKITEQIRATAIREAQSLGPGLVASDLPLSKVDPGNPIDGYPLDRQARSGNVLSPSARPT